MSFYVCISFSTYNKPTNSQSFSHTVRKKNYKTSYNYNVDEEKKKKKTDLRLHVNAYIYILSLLLEQPNR